MKTRKKGNTVLMVAYKLKELFLLLIVISGPELESGQVWSLQQCIDTAFAYNRSLQISKNNVSISEYRQKEANAGLYPKITAIADYKYFLELPYQLMPLTLFGGPEGQFKEAQF